MASGQTTKEGRYMRKYIWLIAALVLATALSLGVATANAGKGPGGNSANAKLCQKGGWMNLQGSDGTQFANQDECVSFGAHGGTIVPKPPCTAGSDNFSDDTDLSQPTTWLGGTIDGPYTGDGGVRIQGTSWNGTFSTGTHLVFTGHHAEANATFRLTFTNPVSSVQLDAESVKAFPTTVTMTAYDASDSVVDTDSDSGITVQPYSLTSSSNNIKYFTMSNDVVDGGVGFSNIVWSCAA
jgi:hypothetical protein